MSLDIEGRMPEDGAAIAANSDHKSAPDSIRVAKDGQIAAGTVEDSDGGAPSSTIDSELAEHAARDDVLAADAQITVQQFGHVTHYRTPFTTQVRDEIRTAYPCDKDIHDDGDSAELKIVLFYTLLRIVTLLLFAGFLNFAIAIAAIYFTGDYAAINVATGLLSYLPAPQPPNLMSALGLTVVVALGLFFLRVAIRWLVLREIVQRGEKFAHNVSQRYSDVLTRLSDNANGIFDRTNKCRWQRSAELFAKAALWNAKRAEYIDRYTTNIAWRNRWFFLRLEFVSFGIKAVLAAGACYFIFAGFEFSGSIDTQQNLIEKLSFCGVIIATLLIGWGYVFRKRGDFWTAAFTKEIKLQSAPQSHYYNMLPRIVANLVALAQSNERNSSA